MPWKKLLALVTGSIDEELRLRNEYITHYHLEGNHQGIGNTLISPRPDSDKDRERDIKCQEGLGGLLKFYHRPDRLHKFLLDVIHSRLKSA